MRSGIDRSRTEAKLFLPPGEARVFQPRAESGVLRLLSFALLLLGAALGTAGPGAAQSLRDPESHYARTQFASYSRGELGALINPAGLAAAQDDDGIRFQVSRSDQDVPQPELNVLISMGGLGLTYLEQREDYESDTARLHVYGVSLAVGGSVFALGNKVKMIEVTGLEGYERVYDLDAGFLLRPIPILALAGVMENASESELLPGLNLARRIRGGGSLLLYDERLVLSLEGSAPDTAKTVDEVQFRAGARVRPIPLLSLYAGAERDPGANQAEDYWFGADLHLGWVTAGASAVGTRDDGIQRLAAQLRWALASPEQSRGR